MRLKDYFQAFIEYKQKTCKNPKTIIDYQRNLKYFAPIAEREISDLKKNDDALVREAAGGHGERGPEIAIVVLRTFLRFLEDEGVTIPFKWERIKIPYAEQKDQPYVTESEFEQSVELLNVNKFYELRDRTLYELLWSTGLRINEALPINIKDIHWDKRQITIKRLKRGLGNVAYISDRLDYWLKRYFERRPEHEAVFVNSLNGDASGRLSDDGSRKRITDYKKSYGDKFKLRHHDLRRGFATHLLDNKVDLKKVQVLGGWKSPRTVLGHYARYDKLQVQDVHSRIYNQAPKTPIVKVVNKILERNDKED